MSVEITSNSTNLHSQRTACSNQSVSEIVQTLKKKHLFYSFFEFFKLNIKKKKTNSVSRTQRLTQKKESFIFLLSTEKCHPKSSIPSHWEVCKCQTTTKSKFLSSITKNSEIKIVLLLPFCTWVYPSPIRKKQLTQNKDVQCNNLQTGVAAVKTKRHKKEASKSHWLDCFEIEWNNTNFSRRLGQRTQTLIKPPKNIN